MAYFEGMQSNAGRQAAEGAAKQLALLNGQIGKFEDCKEIVELIVLSTVFEIQERMGFRPGTASK